MEAKLRRLTNDDFASLSELNAAFYSGKHSAFHATSNLIKDIETQHDFKAFGLFENNILIGFVIGYAIAKKVFYFSGIYVKIRLNRNLKQFIEFCFQEIAKDGYTSWEVDCTNANITKIMLKFGATPIYTRYGKQLEV